ncbi:hypothetical protein SAMD00023353_14000050 [Rosellinia necatrix]|uniref:Uncharacterized protein n=1 Tax=Rosellinia necatrix TaxID=77044 RepID=A0A1S8ABF3_ROSNE|nr:hypothetical protein SAMD00023353_14000050 [Rosellinia necatrix]
MVSGDGSGILLYCAKGPQWNNRGFRVNLLGLRHERSFRGSTLCLGTSADPWE